MLPAGELQYSMEDLIDMIKKTIEPGSWEGEKHRIDALGESLIVNCSGLGSRDLFADETMTPIKGQLTHLVPQPEIDYGTFGGVRREGSGAGMGIHMNPRRDGIAAR